MTIIRQQLRKKIIISIFSIKTEIFPENLLISAQFLLPHNKTSNLLKIKFDIPIPYSQLSENCGAEREKPRLALGIFYQI